MHTMSEQIVDAAGSLAGGPEIDPSRRKFLTLATAGVGVVGAGFVAVPFVESWLPSERARSLGAPVEIDLSKVEPGQMISPIWRLQPIYIVHRTPEMLAILQNHDKDLKDPQSDESKQPAYTKNAQRSVRPDFLVLIGICTHLGCLPKQHFDAGDPVLGANWPGGWLCPCHGSRFDLAGRVFNGSPASVNLVIPPYRFSAANTLRIGEDTTQGAA
jgi:ubiquinol-cytochrome c reductase iron-sulfur subunit